MARRLLNLVYYTALGVMVAAAALWVRARHHTDIVMLAGPPGRCLLLTSHRGGWVEFTVVRTGWREPGVGLWSKDWRQPTRVLPLGADDRGPLKMWQRPADLLNWGPPGLAGEFSLRRGTPAVMVHAASGRPVLDRTRGLTGGVWNNVAPGSPHWAFPPMWEVRVPHWSLVALAALLPLGRLVGGLGKRLRRRLAYRAGHCRRCGYDLRATPQRCPECGEAPTGATVT